MNKTYTFNLIVSEDEIDHLNHVNNIVYVHWVLDAAQKHWEFLSDEALNATYVWVILRHEIDYLAAALLNDTVTINTWVEKSVGVKSDRIVEIKRGDKLLVKAKTTWCLLDKSTMKPARIPTEILSLFH